MKLDIKNPNILKNIKNPSPETVKALGKTALSILRKVGEVTVRGAVKGVVVGATVIGLAAVQDSPTPPSTPAIKNEFPATNNPTPDQVEQALDNNIANLDNGGHVEVSANNIYLPGAIGTAMGRPLVFSTDGQNYLAYAQGQPLNFNQKQPADVSGAMAIDKEPASDKSIPLQNAYLNKEGILVNANQTAVGFVVNSANNK